MSDPVNLNHIRKDRTRADEKQQADANALRHGLTKAQRLLEAAKDEKARKLLDQHHFDDE
ncbi:MAG: hypothetical protein ACI8TF_000507 [Paracoccaceae bacterium]|jgi:hypothetical protein